MRSTADLYGSLAGTLLRLKKHSKFIGRGSVGERPSTSTLALETADKRTSTFPLLPSGWIVTVRRHALFRHLLRHRSRARMLFDIADELKNLEAHKSPALLRLLGQDPHPL